MTQLALSLKSGTTAVCGTRRAVNHAQQLFFCATLTLPFEQNVLRIAHAYLQWPSQRDCRDRPLSS